jgi:hypothetical protein
MADKEWSEDPADDPVELQKEQIKLGKEFLDRIKKEEAERKAREAEYAARPALAGQIRQYRPPTFEEVSVVLKKAWDGVEAIMPTAGDRVKAIAFQTLMQAAAPPPSFVE